MVHQTLIEVSRLIRQPSIQGPIILMFGLFGLCFACPSATADELKPFTTDGCSSFPDGTLAHQSLWLQCCIQHDLSYWIGGTREQRLAADQKLEQCVAKVGEPDIARLMLAGVRVGGSPYLPTSFRWGYGWSWPRGYQSITEIEKNQIKLSLTNLQLMLESLSNQLKQSTMPEDQ